MTLYMETTKKSAESTAHEISILLGQSGASAIQTEFVDRKIVALSFRIDIDGQHIPFRLPVRVEPIFQYLKRKRRRTSIESDRAQAERIAWRQIYYWIKAQLALVETGMVKPAEVFLPYIQTGINETLYQRLEAGQFKEFLALTDNAGVGE